MEVAIKLTKIVTEFDTSKTYVFSKYRYAEFRKLILDTTIHAQENQLSEQVFAFSLVNFEIVH